MPSPWLFAALLLLSLAALAVLVRAQLRVLRSARLAAAPLRARQEVVFEEAGPVVLCLEGPRFTPRFRRLEFELGLPGGAPVEQHRILFRLVTSGLATARISLLRFALPYAGRYVLEIRGLDPRQEAGAPGHTVVFMRPHTASAVLFAAGMTLAGGLAVVSLVFLLLAFVPTAGAIDPGHESRALASARGRRHPLPRRSGDRVRGALQRAAVQRVSVAAPGPVGRPPPVRAAIPGALRPDRPRRLRPRSSGCGSARSDAC